ncbi:hypothetical protein PRSY57_0827400 [Plasmodium reichenowi]|uniref:Uncharacterized protein n=1 Tax=Plasmodium reichenowi TaxID=5854 RepID=A0A151LKF9_PLARE|nr:hypothetical protein PRSY57_0827400 [Plasmodium reichenowi]KYN99367.1 hypothetical protein PRSY57_0827400 [Plasmodium reichenowi]
MVSSLEGTYINIKRFICHYSNSFYFLKSGSIYYNGNGRLINYDNVIIKEKEICKNKKRKTSTCYNNNNNNKNDDDKVSCENDINEDIIIHHNVCNNYNMLHNIEDKHLKNQYIQQKMYELIKENGCEKDKIMMILDFICNDKFKNKNDFLFFSRHLLMLCELYKDIIIINENIYNNSHIINYIKECIHFVIISKKYSSLNSLFKYFNLLCIFHINDIRLIQKIFYLILCNKHFNDIKEKVIYSYYIIQYLYNNHIFNEFISNLLTNKLLLRIHFVRFLQAQNDIKNNFLIFLYYIIHSLNNNTSKDIIIQIYVTYYNNMLQKNIQSFKNIVNLNLINQLHYILLISQYYDSNLNMLIKKNIQTYLPFLNIYEIILACTNLLLNFTKNNKILLHIPYDEIRKGKKELMESKTNNNNNNNIIINNSNISNSNICNISICSNSENGKTTHFKNYYHNFLSMKYLCDSIIRTSDNYISSFKYTHNNEYIYMFLVLSSYCHFTLYSNWWADTSIYFKLKKKKKKKKKVLRSRLPYIFHLQEKIAHILDLILYNSSYSNESYIQTMGYQRDYLNNEKCIGQNQKYDQLNEDNPEENNILSKCNNKKNRNIQNNVEYNHTCSTTEEKNYENSLIKCKANIIDIKYVTYIFKSFLRISLFNPGHVKNKKNFILLLENSFTNYVNRYIYNYQHEDQNFNEINNKNHLIKRKETDEIHRSSNNNVCIDNQNINVTHNMYDDKNNNLLYKEPFHFNIYDNDLSLYEISSICECFFLVEHINSQHFQNVNNIKVVKKKKNIQNNNALVVEKEKYVIFNSDDIFEKTLYIFLDKMNRFLCNKKLNLTTSNENYIKNVLLEKFLNQGDIFFNYYLLLRLLLPLLFSTSHDHYILLTKKLIIHILFLIFHKQMKQQIDEGIKNNILHITNVINNYMNWENSFIYINNQRRIRKQTKTKMNILDFIYTGEFIRPSFLLILLINELKKYDDMFDQFIQNIFKNDPNIKENKKDLTNYIDKMYKKMDALVIEKENEAYYNQENN